MTIKYEFDDAGYILATVRDPGKSLGGNPDIVNPGTLVTENALEAVMTTEHYDGIIKDEDAIIHGGGWSFVLENGVPKKDGDKYLLVPPSYYIPPANENDYIFAAMVKAGFIEPSNVSPAIINRINWSLNSTGSPILEKTELVATPIRSCTTKQPKPA